MFGTKIKISKNWKSHSKSFTAANIASTSMKFGQNIYTYIGVIKLSICPGKNLHWLQRYIIVKLRSMIFKFHAERSVIYEMRFIISKTILRKCTWFRKWGPEFWKFTRKSHMERSTIFKMKSKIAHVKTQTYRSTIFTMWGKIFCINA